MTIHCSSGTVYRAPRPATAKRAIDVWELCDWAFRRQRAREAVEAFEGRDERWLAGGGSAMARVQSVGLLGVVVDGGGSIAAAEWCDPDAVRVYVTARAVLDTRRLVRLLMAVERGAMPDWGADIKPSIVTFEPNWRVHRRTESVVVRSNLTGAVWCPIAYRDQTAEIVYAREQWRDAWRALRELAGALGAEGLERFAVTGPRFPAEPWAEAHGSAKRLTTPRAIDKASRA